MYNNVLSKCRTCLSEIYHMPERKKIEMRYNKFCKNDYEDRNIDYQSRVLSYVEKCKLTNVDYMFSASSQKSSIYSSTYACLIYGMLKSFSEEDKTDWIQYFDSKQRSDGLFEEPLYDDENYYNGRDGWGARHLVPHITIAYDRLGALPKYEFAYLNKFKNPDMMIQWLDTLDYRNIWSSSNAIMNYGVAMQYARDRMGMPFEKSVEAMEEYLVHKLNKKYAMWFDGEIRNEREKYEMIRGAYHILPILYYDHIDIPDVKKAVEQLLESQNNWGGFDTYIASSACDDIDGLDPLLRLATLAKMDDERIDTAVEKAKVWILFNQNEDGGFVFERNTPFTYGNQQILSSVADESNLFATWFRLVSLKLIDCYNKKTDGVFIRTPGYECPL